MRQFLSLIAIIIILTILPTTTPAAEPADPQDNKESIIIEVEGDPQAHKEYLETYYPFIEVIATYEKLFNGLALKAAPDKFDKLNTLEFVKAIHSVQTYEATSFTKTKTLTKEQINANTVIPSDLNTTNYTGEGVKVGIIDTGIDYTHPDLTKNYQAGYDVVDLDEDPQETVPEQGIPTLHGTHVAGIIAADGDLQGVAPNAEIYAYRALGPGGMGTSVQVIAAMEQALNDGVDIMNLSLGNTVNGPDYPTSVAVNRAVELGVSVVIANGNDGPGNWTVGSPATASKALAVGATSNPQKIPFLYEARSDKSFPLFLMQGSVPWDLDKSNAIAVDKQTNQRGKIALIERGGNIPFYEKAKQAEESGAIAVVIYNNEEGIFQGSVENEEDPIGIPVAGITQQVGEWLLQELKDDSLYIETVYQETPRGIAEFSSRGPVTVNWDIKPDILAPGTNILSTVPGGYQELQGTSMAAPHVAGVIALIKEAHPNWSNKQITGALKTTAVQITNQNNGLVEPIIQGMGLIQPEAAIETNTIIHNPQLAFGKMDDYRQTKTMDITIENTTNKTQSYSFTIPAKQKGMQWKLPQSFTLGKKERKTIPIELSITTLLLEDGIHQGWITLNQQDKTYQLPYLFVNKTADNPKAMGFDFSLKPFSDDEFLYHLYITDPTKRVEVDLYDPDTLMYERTLLETEDLKVGMNEGQLKKADIGKPGQYIAIITIQLESGKYESYETELYIE